MNVKITSYQFQSQNWGDWSNKIYIFYFKKEIIATAQFYYYYSKPNTGVISNLYVTGTFRGNGLGNEIMKILINSSIVNSFDEVRLWVGKNSWQQKWYEKMGFIVLKDKDSDNFWMSKRMK